jgi:hypothetical protein
MRRLLIVLVLVLAVAAPTASAQSPIAGGGSFNDAPVLAPGRYKDTLRGGEQLFYAVSLKPGQKLTAGLTVSGRTDTSYFMKLGLYSLLREKHIFDGEQTESYGQSDRSASLRVEGQRVGRRTAASPTASTPSRAPTTCRSPPTTRATTSRRTSSTPWSTCR